MIPKEPIPVRSSHKPVTVADLKKHFPSRKNAITDEVVELINEAQSDPLFEGESLLSSAITYESVMVKHRAGMHDYIRALKFCAALVAMEDNYTEAYKRTFWDRDFVQSRLNEPTDSNRYRELTSAASRYRKSPLVVSILTVSQVPLDLLFMGARYKAVGVLADLMTSAKYDRDKIAAAKELLAATKGPENMKIELDVGVRENSAVQQLTEQLAFMAAKQKMLLEAGASSLGELGAMKPTVEATDVEVEDAQY
jgi:hypothetical protein